MNYITMRDVFLDELYKRMRYDDKIVLLSVDFGAPALDQIRQDFPDNFINVGIAEQNAINISVGLSLEGYKVFIFGISSFISMRCYEQIRVNLSLLSHYREINVNIISVGCGISYTTSGPTHHCLEDISIMRTLPNIEIFSPSDCSLISCYIDRSIRENIPKYIRLDGSLTNFLTCLPFKFNCGFRKLKYSDKFKVVVISTGYMSYIIDGLKDDLECNLIDLFLLTSYSKNELLDECVNCDIIVSIEEGFGKVGGLSAELQSLFLDKKVYSIGCKNNYCLKVADRDNIHKEYGIDKDSITKLLYDLFKKIK